MLLLYGASGPTSSSFFTVDSSVYPTRNVIDISGGSNKLYIEPTEAPGTFTGFIIDGFSIDYSI